MAKTAWINRNERKRATVKKYAALRAELKAKRDYAGLAQLPRDASPSRVVNRCEVTGRRRAFIRRFKMSRLTFRDLASHATVRVRLMNIPVLFLLAGAWLAENVPPHWDPPMLIIGKLAAIAALVALNAFFVACEFSVVKVRTTQLDALLEEGNVRAHFVKHVRGHLDAYLSATQLGITLASL